ncbi:hypothetical protein GCM10009548_65310 [Streptomyces malaysiensis subsp. malaysiensis]
MLLHGVPKTGYHWRHLVPKLTARYTVVVPDLRGPGDSAHPADGFDVATMGDDTAALMAHLGHGSCELSPGPAPHLGALLRLLRSCRRVTVWGPSSTPARPKTPT